MNTSNTFDLVVVGAGAAGSSVASATAERGLSVALVEQWKVGGTCLNVGCDPTKTLVRSAEVAHLARTAGRFGIGVSEVDVEWSAIQDRVEHVIDTIRGGDGDQNLRDQGIALIKAHGHFVDATTLIAGDRSIVGDRFLVATGARNRVPPIDGLERVGFITSDNVLELEELPTSMAIVGSGLIGVEYAQIFARLGVQITLIGSRDYVLPREEPALRAALLQVLQREGVSWVPELHVDGVAEVGGMKVMTGNRDGETIQIATEEIMIATGRVPNVDRLGLDNAGIQANDNGVVVDSRLRTTNPTVYAAGDVTGVYNFTHIADYQARIVEHNLFEEGTPLKTDYRVVPWVTFTDPELARVGLTEEEARAGGFDSVAATLPFADLPRAMTMDEREGMVKLVVDRETRLILGGHILGSRAGELIGEVSVAMQNRLPVDAIASTVHPYPTMSEGVFWTAYQIVNNLLDAPRGAKGRLAS